MIYYKIEQSGCVEHKGLCQMRADFYDDSILTDCKIIPVGGYQGKVDADNIPVDLEDYNKWYDSLPTEKKLLPFHTHFIYFEPQHTDEEILFCFELALDWRKKNMSMKNVKPVWKENNKSLSESRIADIKTKDFTTVKNAEIYSVK